MGVQAAPAEAVGGFTPGGLRDSPAVGEETGRPRVMWRVPDLDSLCAGPLPDAALARVASRRLHRRSGKGSDPRATLEARTTLVRILPELPAWRALPCREDGARAWACSLQVTGALDSIPMWMPGSESETLRDRISALAAEGWMRGEGRGGPTRESSRRAARLYVSLAGDSVVAPWALRRAAEASLAAGDSTRADSCWSALALRPVFWQWHALRAAVGLRIARRDTAGSLTLLVSVGDRAGWTQAQLSAADGLEARLRAAQGDTARALDLAWRALGRGSMPAAAELEDLFQLWRDARHETLTVVEEAMLAEIDLSRGERERAVERLARAGARATGEARAELGLRRALVLRQLNRFADAQNQLEASFPFCESVEMRSRLELEGARIERDAGRLRAAYRLYQRVGRGAAPAHLRQTAWSELGEAAESEADWSRARGAFEHAYRQQGPRAGRFAFQLAVLAESERKDGEARRWWSRAQGEGAEWWRARHALRARPSQGEALLREIAARSAYTYYRAAARETLEARTAAEPLALGWRERPRVARAGQGARDIASLELPRRLLEAGLLEDCAQALVEWSAVWGREGVAARGASDPQRTRLLLQAAHLAYAADQPSLGLRLAERMGRAVADSSDETRWSAIPWVYPPAYDSLIASAAERSQLPDRRLLQSLIWQESKFDPQARSRTGARGLGQLQLQTAAGIARELREPTPTDSALAEASLSLRYAGHYLAQLLRRFRGRVPVALAAYNAGPTVVARWLAWRGSQEDAIFVERIPFPQTLDYVKQVMAAWRAYRELEPASAPSPFAHAR